MGEGGEVKESNRSPGTRKSSPVKEQLLLETAFAQEWERNTEQPKGFLFGGLSLAATYKFTAEHLH